MIEKRKISTIVEILVALDTEYETNPNFLNFRKGVAGPWSSISTREFLNKVWYVALALRDMGIVKQSVGLLSDSCPDWHVVDFGILLAGCHTVPLFSNMNNKNLIFEIKDCQMEVLYVASEEKWNFLQPHVALFKTIFANGITKDVGHKSVMSYEDLIQKGKKLSTLPGASSVKDLVKGVASEDLATIVYTSGTTGVPKGVPLTHANLVHQVNACCEVYGHLVSGQNSVVCLPLAHIFQRAISFYQIRANLSMYFVDDIKNLIATLQQVQPLFLAVVPRILEKAYSRIFERVISSKGITRLLGGLAFNRAKVRNPHSWVRWPWDFLYDILVYSKLRKIFGGKLVLCSSGGAALSHEIHTFFLNIGLPLFQGYGLTETSPVICANFDKKCRVGTVGTKFPGVQIKFSEEREILVKGANVMKGYYNNAALTKEVFTEDGWFKTGDLGTMDADGFLTIIGKNKEMFKTTHGKYVVAVVLEAALKKSMLVDMAMIIADGRPYVSALLFLNPEKLPLYKKRWDVVVKTEEEFLKHPKVREYFNDYIDKVNMTLSEWEKVRRYSIVLDVLTVESGLLTPKMSLRRATIEKKYEDLVEGMYK